MYTSKGQVRGCRHSALQRVRVLCLCVCTLGVCVYVNVSCAQVLNLTLVDLPGITKVPVGGLLPWQ